jgi:hypothetical protein
VRIIHAWQHRRCCRNGHDPVHQAERKLARRQQGGHDKQYQPPKRKVVLRSHTKNGCCKCQRQHHNHADIQQQRDAEERTAHAHQRVMTIACFPFQNGKTFIDQVIPHVRTDTGYSAARCTVVRELEGNLGNLDLISIAGPCKTLHDVAILVARGEIHILVNARGILPQGLLDNAKPLDECMPIDCTKVAKARDAIAYRYLIGCLLLRLKLQFVLDTRPGFGETLLHPRQRQRQHGTLALQAPGELCHEGAGHRRLRARHIGNADHHTLRIALGDFSNDIRPFASLIAIIPVSQYARGGTPQVFDQGKAKHDRNRPQLADRQRLHRLIGIHEAPEAFIVDAPIAVRDDFQCKHVDTRYAVRIVLRKAGQLAVIALGQMSLRNANLLFDQIVVVQQPLTRGRNAAITLGSGGERLACLQQHACILIEPLEQTV